MYIVARQPLSDAAGTTFPASVEQWRDRVTSAAGDLPVEWLLAWIAKESGGNPCSYTQYRESGIFQLMPGSNMAAGNTTEAELRAACTGSSQKATRQLTSDELDVQVQSGIDYIDNYARPTAHRFLDAAGANWPESTADFWTMVKMVFNLPGPIAGWLANATTQLGHPPATWAELRSTINGYAVPLDNAEWVGAYGDGGGSGTSSTNTLLLVGGLAAIAFLTWRYAR